MCVCVLKGILIANMNKIIIGVIVVFIIVIGGITKFRSASSDYLPSLLSQTASTFGVPTAMNLAEQYRQMMLLSQSNSSITLNNAFRPVANPALGMPTPSQYVNPALPVAAPAVPSAITHSALWSRAPVSSTNADNTRSASYSRLRVPPSSKYACRAYAPFDFESRTGKVRGPVCKNRDGSPRVNYPLDATQENIDSCNDAIGIVSDGCELYDSSYCALRTAPGYIFYGCMAAITPASCVLASMAGARNRPVPFSCKWTVRPLSCVSDSDIPPSICGKYSSSECENHLEVPCYFEPA